MIHQRVFNLSKWRLIEEGEAVTFGNVRARTVILEVNAPARMQLFVCQDVATIANEEERQRDAAAGRPIAALPVGSGDDGLTQFLALVEGRQRIEFAVAGRFELLAVGGPCYFYTADGMELATRIVAPVIYTRLANRRQRNPHLEMMEYQMRLNQERFAAAVAAEANRRIEALERKLESYAPQRDIRTPPSLVGRPVSGQNDAEPGPVEASVAAPSEGGADEGEGSAGERALRKGRSAKADNGR